MYRFRRSEKELAKQKDYGKILIIESGKSSCV